jgi:hypothetical protein
MADAGEVRNLVEAIWNGEISSEQQEDPMETVCIAMLNFCIRSSFPGGQATHLED